jgi:hypothetical protein
MPRVLFFLQSAFSLWMLVDAVGRPGIARYWYWIILMPFGEWFYFFKFKIHDPDFAWLKAPFRAMADRPASVEKLRFQLQQTPSLANKVSLAQALHDAEALDEAAELFEEVLKSDATSRDALYGLGVSRIGLGDYEGAIEPLQTLLDVEPFHQEYDGWAKLAHAFWELGRRDDTVSTLARLVRMSPRLAHRVAYAHYLGQMERRDEAQAQLVTALQEFEYAPKYLKRSQHALAKRAKEMLHQISAAS